MKISSFTIKDCPPLKRVDVDGIADVLVVAGPNGVGKTRLLNSVIQGFQAPGQPTVRLRIEATCPSEVNGWGKHVLDTAVPADVQILRRQMQKNQRRGRLRSGLLNFDSSRRFEQVKAYAFSWDFSDPFEEEIGWNQSFQPMSRRFTDTIHALHRKLRSQKEQIAKKALALQNDGVESMDLDFPDPLLRFKDAFKALLPGKELVDLDEKSQNIKYSEASGMQLLLSELSSGEREVVSVVFDFLLRDPKDTIVVFDEPELHLHPELSYRLLRTLQDAGERNQFIFCTHSPDIIAASLDHSVVFISPADREGKNQALPVLEDDETARVLHLLGQSVGVIALGQKLVLIEGERTSLDKQTYGSILGAEGKDLVLVPAGGRDAIARFAKALDTVLSKSIWGVEFFLLCDGDAAVPTSELDVLESGSAGRVKRLPRYHLENYFLEPSTLAQVFEQLEEPADSELRDAQTIEAKLKEFARPLLSYAAALRVSHQIRTDVGNADIMVKGCDQKTADELVVLLEAKRLAEEVRVGTALGQAALEAKVREEYKLLQDALARDDGSWRALIPGRPILHRFAAYAKEDKARLKRLYIKAAASSAMDPFEEIRDIFRGFSGSHTR